MGSLDVREVLTRRMTPAEHARAVEALVASHEALRVQFDALAKEKAAPAVFQAPRLRLVDASSGICVGFAQDAEMDLCPVARRGDPIQSTDARLTFRVLRFVGHGNHRIKDGSILFGGDIA